MKGMLRMTKEQVAYFVLGWFYSVTLALILGGIIGAVRVVLV